MTGLKLATVVRRDWPRIRVVCTSGKPPADSMPPEVAFLASPV